MDLLPTPVARDYKDSHSSQRMADKSKLTGIAFLLPTPATSDRFGANRPGTRGGADALRTVACFELADRDLLRSPTLSDVKTPDRSGLRAAKGHKTNLADQIEAMVPVTDWGKYEPAIRMWEGITREAPDPTEVNSNGRPRLAAAFSEWMMGFPKGWITDLIGNWRQPDQISRAAALKAIGNAVVPQQAVAALTVLLED